MISGPVPWADTKSAPLLHARDVLLSLLHLGVHVFGGVGLVSRDGGDGRRASAFHEETVLKIEYASLTKFSYANPFSFRITHSVIISENNTISTHH